MGWDGMGGAAGEGPAGILADAEGEGEEERARRLILCPERVGALGRWRFKRSRDKGDRHRHPREEVSELSARSVYILKGGWSWLGAGSEPHRAKPRMRGFQAAEEACLELTSISLCPLSNRKCDQVTSQFRGLQRFPRFLGQHSTPNLLLAPTRTISFNSTRALEPPNSLPWLKACRSFLVLKPPRFDSPL